MLRRAHPLAARGGALLPPAEPGGGRARHAARLLAASGRAASPAPSGCPGRRATSYLQFFFPGTIVLVLLFAAIFSTISVIEDRHEGFLQGVLVAPVAAAPSSPARSSAARPSPGSRASSSRRRCAGPALPGAHRDQHGDVPGFFHHHHNQRDEDVEGGHEDDEADGDEGDDALEAQGAEEGAVLLHPVRGLEAFAGCGFDLVADGRGAVDVVHLEFDYAGHVSEAEQMLRVRQGAERPGGVVVVEAGLEDSHHFESHVARHHAEGRELALRAGDQHDGAYGCAKGLGEVFAEHDGRHGGEAGVDAGQVVGGWGFVDCVGGGRVAHRYCRRG